MNYNNKVKILYKKNITHLKQHGKIQNMVNNMNLLYRMYTDKVLRFLYDNC